MRVRCLVLAVLAGCSFPHGTPATGDGPANGSDDAPPPSDAAVDSTAVSTDAPPDTPPPPTDTDNDTIPDTTDNCPTVANTNQRDHDGDNHGDACDRCPHLASATDPDGDGDGVGDACDPRPTTAGDSIVLFEGFYDATSIANWTAGGGGLWSVANGVLTQSSSATSGDNTLSPPITVTRAAVTTSAKAIALGDSSNAFNTPYISVTAAIAPNQSYWCSLVDEDNGDKIYASTIQGLNRQFPNTNWPGTFAANSVVQLNLALLGNNNACTVTQAPATTAVVMGNTGNVAGGVQVATRTASASFDYLFVVKIGN
ncbi:MAG: hypothetical protein HOV81_18690 [Kofleriaceae bacterium]|nr:hypothetical protein [Kofleriaceae bacterium]